MRIKKPKKLHSKKLVEIKNIYFQFNFTTCKSCPYVLRFFVPQLRDRKCNIPMHGSLMILYSGKRQVPLQEPRIKTTVLINMLPLKCCRLYCRLVLICRPRHYILLFFSNDSFLVPPFFCCCFLLCVVRFFVFMEKNVLLRRHKTVPR